MPIRSEAATDCTFCIIPSMRGGLVSRPIGDVLEEAKNLAGPASGKSSSSLWTTGLRARSSAPQQASGAGWPGEDAAQELCEGAGQLRHLGACTASIPYRRSMRDSADGRGQDPAVSRCALPACQPARAEGDAATGERRATSSASRAWRAICPDLTIRSTFIAGFPWRNRKPSSELAFLEKRSSTALAILRSKAPEANQLAGAVPEAVRERQRQLMELRKTSQPNAWRPRSAARSRCWLTKSTRRGHRAQQADAPEIPTASSISTVFSMSPGDFLTVRVVDTDAQ